MAADLVDFNVKTKMPRTLRDALDRYCDDHGISKAEIVRAGIARELEARRATIALPSMPNENDFSEVIGGVRKLVDGFETLVNLGKGR